MPLFPETKMADVGKLISLGNLLIRKVTWFVLTTTPATLILSRDFGADCITRVAYIYSRLSRTHSFSIWTYRDNTHTHSLSLHCDLQKQHALSLIFWHPAINPTKMYTFYNLFFLVLPFRLDLLQLPTQPQKFRQTPKKTNNQHGRRHMPSSTRCYISIYHYLTWNT